MRRASPQNATPASARASLSPPCRQQHRRKVRGGWKHDPSAPERRRNAFGRLKHYHRRDYHLSALSSSVFPGAFAGSNNVEFQRCGSVPVVALLPPPTPPQLLKQRQKLLPDHLEAGTARDPCHLGCRSAASPSYTLPTWHLMAMKQTLAPTPFQGRGEPEDQGLPLALPSASARWDVGSHQHYSSLLLPLLSLAFARSSENLPKVPLQSWHQEAEVLPQLVLQPGTTPITVLPSQLSHNILVPVMPCCADLPSDLLPLYYRSYEEHKLFNKFGRPVWNFKFFSFNFFFPLFSFSIINSLKLCRAQGRISQEPITASGFSNGQNLTLHVERLFWYNPFISPPCPEVHISKRVPGLQAS